MNNLAITPYIAMHALQIQNVKRNIVKKASINELNMESTINQESSIQQEPIQQIKPIENNHENINNIPTEGTTIDNLPIPASNDNSIGAEL
jgi:hypothetical protein